MKSKSFALSVACVRETDTNLTVIRQPHEVYREVADIADLAQEAFVVLLLTRKYHLLDRALVTLGILDASLVHPREVFRPAISASASSIILAHNHPSGDPTPSVEDIRITRQLIAAGKILGIEVLDHVVIGRGVHPFVSIRESGLVAFGGE